MIDFEEIQHAFSQYVSEGCPLHVVAGLLGVDYEELQNFIETNEEAAIEYKRSSAEVERDYYKGLASQLKNKPTATTLKLFAETREEKDDSTVIRVEYVDPLPHDGIVFDDTESS